MKRPLFSFVIPTYNSEKTLAKTLMSIMQQGFEPELLEILIIDGGSTDATLEIAAKYGALIIENPKRLPEYAKFIGMNKATGKYIVKMDSDEAFISNLQLKKRLQLVEKWPDVKCVVADRLKKPTEGNWGIANEYINLFGDPFSFFVYKSKGTVLKSFKKSVK
ncbi:MAG: glycosyltransferase, partial [Christensenella sp.]